jgi:fatty acid amide hydrolase
MLLYNTYANIALSLVIILVPIAIIISIMIWFESKTDAANIKLRLQKNANKKRESRDADLDNLNMLMFTPSQDLEKRVMSYSAQDLWSSMHDKYSKNPLTCTEIMSVYCFRAVHAQKKTNCLAEVCFWDALIKAKQVDEKIMARRNGFDNSEPRILEGIPISVKEELEQKGYDATCGLAVRCYKPMKKTGLLLSLLCDEGAIPYVRTNVPQMLLLPESVNSIWGRTTNPWSHNRTSGGSSGGEAALLAAGGSILGIGTDIGGSLRNPAAFCGIYSFKPTPQRLTLEGMSEPCYDSENGTMQIRAVAGPMALCTEDLEMIMKAWTNNKKMSIEDPTVPYLPWKQVDKKQLRIGYYVDDGYFTASKGCQNAVRNAVESLKQKTNHVLVEWNPPVVKECVGIYYSIMSADNCVNLLKGLEGEELLSIYTSLVRMTKVPRFLQRILSWLLQKFGQERAGQMLEWCRGRTVDELMKVHIEQTKVVKIWIDKMKEDNIDCIICPGTALPAFTHNSSADLTMSLSYNFIFNVLHFPVGTVPITTVNKEEDEEGYVDNINDMFTAKAKEVCKNSIDCPVAVQVIGLPYNDEIVISLMKDQYL